MRKWTNERLPYIAMGIAVVGMFLWSWWLIRHLNGWADKINVYIYQTNVRLELIEEQLLELQYIDEQQAATERNA